MNEKSQESSDRLPALLERVTELLEKHRSVEDLARRRHGRTRNLVDSLVRRQHLATLKKRLKKIHPADLAYVLEALPTEERFVIWGQVSIKRRGAILLELSQAVQESLFDSMSRDQIMTVTRELNADEIAEIADAIPRDVLQELYQALPPTDRDWLRSSVAYDEDAVGHWMSQEMVIVRAGDTLGEVLRELRGRGDLPNQTDKLFVVDKHGILQGILPLRTLVLNDPATQVQDVMATDIVTFNPQEPAADAAMAFQRYDLISAPIVDERRKIMGRLTVDVIMDFIREDSEEEALNMAGLRREEDLFAPVWNSARNRWLWLSVNLMTAFVASRVIGLFEDTIVHLVALATLMPIVAGMGGNTGNQTIALIIRGLALGQINSGNVRHLITKELAVSLLNGVVWGSVVGLCAYALYWNPSIGVVMAVAMLLNLIVAAIVGMAVPLTLHKLGRDPALGSSVLLTFMTDSMGFLIFLGLATIFLL